MTSPQRNAHERTTRRRESVKYPLGRDVTRPPEHKGPAGVASLELRARIDDQLNRLSEMLFKTMKASETGHGADGIGNVAGSVVAALLQKRIAFLGQLATGLVLIDSDSVPARGAGYGSTVIGEELFSGRRHEYTLMVGSLIDIDAGQVSLASPIGQALFGCEIGDVVEIEVPHQRFRLRILSVTTIDDVLERNELVTADA